jgi:hypothetical protein
MTFSISFTPYQDASAPTLIWRNASSRKKAARRMAWRALERGCSD